MSKKIKFKITHQFDEIEMSQKDYQQILSMIEWSTTPSFIDAGRTGWHILQNHAFVRSSPKQPLMAAKMKGIGFWNPQPKEEEYRQTLKGIQYADDPMQPTMLPFATRSTYPHFAVNKQEEYFIAYSEDAPLGGIVHNRGLLEFTNAKILLKNKIPAIRPFLVVEYDPSVYQFNEKPMGVVVSLSPKHESLRLHNVLYGKTIQRGTDTEADLFYDNIRDVLNVSGDPMSEITRLKTVNKLAKQLGKLLHDFAAVGLYRHSSDWNNFEFDVNEGQIFLTDLDSSRQLKDIPPVRRTLEVLRDLASATYRLVGKFGYPNALGHYTIKNLLIYNPLREFLLGYFPNASYEEVTAVTEPLWNYFIPHLALVRKYKEPIWKEWSLNRRKTYKVDHDLFYTMGMTLLYPLLQKSDLFKLYPCDITVSDLEQKAKNYLKERYEYYCHLMDRSCYFQKDIETKTNRKQVLVHASS